MAKNLAKSFTQHAPIVFVLFLAIPASLSAAFAIIALNTIGAGGAGPREFALVIGVWFFVSFGAGGAAYATGRRIKKELEDHALDIASALPEELEIERSTMADEDFERMNLAIAKVGRFLGKTTTKSGKKGLEEIKSQLILEKRRFEAFLRGIGDCVTIVDLEYRIIYMNDMVKKIFGDRLGEHCYKVFEHKSDVCGGCPVKLSYASGGVETSLRRVYTKEDKLLYMENTGSPIRDEDGSIIAGIELARDVSQRIRLERNVEIRSRELAVANEDLRVTNEQLQSAYEELKAAQNALVQSEKMASLGVLVSGVAHEINNPTNFVYGSITLLEENIKDLLALVAALDAMPISDDDRKIINKIKEEMDYDYVREDLKKLVKNVYTGAKRIKEIVQNLRTFSRVDSGETAEINIHEGIDSTLEILHHEFKNRIEIHKEYDPMPQLTGSPGKLNQVFMNVLHNAIQSIPDKGDITIRTFVEDAKVVVEIKDSGIGIPEDRLSHIFDPFFTTKEVGEGTGLGLAISYSIIQDHGGELIVKSREGEGTTMRIELPVDGK